MGGKPVTKPGQSQTVNIARTISAVSSAALFRPEAIKQILSAGWGTITGHEDTEKIPNCPSKPRIGMRKGRGTIPLEKSYCTGDDNPTDMFRPSEPTLCHIADSFATRARGRWLLAASKKQKRSDSPATGRRTPWNLTLDASSLAESRRGPLS